MEIIIKNGTPHAVKVVDKDGVLIREILPEEITPRCSTTLEVVGDVAGIPISRTAYGKVEDLPDPEEGVFWIVSALVRTQLPERKDLLSPGQLVRDSEGKVIGCKSLDSNL